MGLGLYVNDKRCAGWSYSGFNAFREKVARQAGIELNKMEGFHDIDRSILEKQGWEAYRQAMEADLDKPKISWDTIDDPIVPLLHHSDCDGTIEAPLCGALADRLEELIRDWPERMKLQVDPFWQERGYSAEMELDDYDTVQAKGLIQGLREAAATGHPLEFH